MSLFGWSMPPGCGALPAESDGAVEVKVGGVWWAWDESDRVFVQDPAHPAARDDGYRYVAQLQPDEQFEGSPESQLKYFVYTLKENV